MRIIFAGTPEFALPALQALLNSQHKVCAIYSQPDRPAGRGQKITASPVKQFALVHNLPVYQPQNLQDSIKQLQDFNADVFINVAYGMILPTALLTMHKFGGINIHPSLLPRWRGAAPIQRAIMAGEQTTGVTVMQMEAKLDAGGIYKQLAVPIATTDTAATLSLKAATLGAKLLLEVLADLTNDTASVSPQDENKATYAKKIIKEEGNVIWQNSAQSIAWMIRAFNPWPVAYTEIAEKTIRIWQADHYMATTQAAPGTIVQVNDNSIDVATGHGILRLLTIQLPGKKPQLLAEILHAYRHIFAVGKIFLHHK